MRYHDALSTHPPRYEPIDAHLAAALRSAVAAGSAVSTAVHDGVCRLAREARRHGIPSSDLVNAIATRARPIVAALPSFARREFERQVGWWVAQEYHRDD